MEDNIIIENVEFNPGLFVRYKVNGTNRYKCGYVQWKGGAK